jgi:hypothetical protein
VRDPIKTTGRERAIYTDEFFLKQSMYGTLLDQKVFEHLVQRCLPVIHEHLVEADVQLSVASLPWFLSIFISSMPLVFAFRYGSPTSNDARDSGVLRG